jgi:putative oxidoreductase
MKRLWEWRGHAYLACIGRLYLGGLFLFACFHKIADPHAFAVDIATYQILPRSLVNVMAIVLPWVEFATGLMLVAGLRVRAAVLLASAMMLTFLAAISIALGRGLELSCGCFASQGALEDPISFRTVLRDSAWLVLCLYVMLVDRVPLGLDLGLERKRRPRRIRPIEQRIA